MKADKTKVIEHLKTSFVSRQQQRDQAAASLSLSGTPKKTGSPAAKLALHGSYGKLIFCKRIYRRLHDLPDDPVEYHLLYAQAQHYLVHVCTISFIVLELLKC